ncbi:MAG TPA: energy transducer TonB [Terriglobales bacterium]|nr:energy transducer TonB [Terriglobales bacterium]
MNRKPLAAFLLAIALSAPTALGAQDQQTTAPQQAIATTKAKFISGRDPGYTDAAREARIEGTVILTLTVDEKGKVKTVKVHSGLDKGLDKNAVNAAKKWKFEPATVDGKPVASEINVSVDFRLYR